MNGFTRTASYSRVSSQRQTDEMTIDSQVDDLRVRGNRDQFPVDASFEYIDDGYSGSELMRPALERLRDHIAASMIDRLYIHSPDRLARKFAHQAILLEEFRKHGCEVIFLNQDGLPDSPETTMLIQMQGMFAEYEREKILERTRRGRRYSATKGNVSVFGRAPYGYNYLRKCAQHAARWEVDAATGPMVKVMFELVADQGCSLRQVCRELQSRKVLTQRGNEVWDSATVRGILINPAYYGEARYGKVRLAQRNPGRRAKRGDPEVPRQAKVTVATSAEDQIVITVPAIVSKKLFEEVGKRMEENRKRQREHRDGPKYLLSGLMICGECGSAYCARRPCGSTNFYYRCIGTDKHRHSGQAICNNSSLIGAAIESKVWIDLCELLSDPDRLLMELERRKQAPSTNAQTLVSQQSRVDELSDRLKRLIDAYTQGLIELPEFESRIGPLRSLHDRELASLASQRGEHAESLDTTTAAKHLQLLASTVGQKLEYASFEEKRELLTSLVKRIEVHHKQVTIVYKVPQNPFVQSPANRGKLQHRLSLHAVPIGTKTNAIAPRLWSKSGTKLYTFIWSARIKFGSRSQCQPCMESFSNLYPSDIQSRYKSRSRPSILSNWGCRVVDSLITQYGRKI